MFLGVYTNVFLFSIPSGLVLDLPQKLISLIKQRITAPTPINGISSQKVFKLGFQKEPVRVWRKRKKRKTKLDLHYSLGAKHAFSMSQLPFEHEGLFFCECAALAFWV